MNGTTLYNDSKLEWSDYPTRPLCKLCIPEGAANLNVNAALLEKQRAEWLTENKSAIDTYNEHAEKHGVFSDGLRSF